MPTLVCTMSVGEAIFGVCPVFAHEGSGFVKMAPPFLTAMTTMWREGVSGITTT